MSSEIIEQANFYSSIYGHNRFKKFSCFPLMSCLDVAFKWLLNFVSKLKTDKCFLQSKLKPIPILLHMGTYESSISLITSVSHSV